MLQLLISVLLSFGFSYNDQGKLVGSGELNKQDVIQQMKNNADYQTLGGDGALDAIVIGDNVDPIQ